MYKAPTTTAEVEQFERDLQDKKIFPKKRWASDYVSGQGFTDPYWKDIDYCESLTTMCQENWKVKFEGFVFEVEEEHGGCEGDGETYYVIFSIKPKGGEKVYFKYDGYYQSYHGSELTSIYKVYPRYSVTKHWGEEPQDADEAKKLKKLKKKLQ